MMTDEQAAWLRTHPDYEIIGQQGLGSGLQMAGGSGRHHRMGALEADGTFHPRTKPVPPAILVGIRKPLEPTPGGRMGFA